MVERGGPFDGLRRRRAGRSGGTGQQLGFGADWAQRLAASRTADQGEMLRAASDGGPPFGDEKFVAQMERKIKRPLTKGWPGRKPKALSAAAR